MDDLVCLTVVADVGETEAAFHKRLIVFWSHMLRQHEATYECVYAEATQFTTHEQRVARQYFVAVPGVAVVTQQLATAAFVTAPIDLDDTYSRYEATSPDWFQIEH